MIEINKGFMLKGHFGSTILTHVHTTGRLLCSLRGCICVFVSVRDCVSECVLHSAVVTQDLRAAASNLHLLFMHLHRVEVRFGVHLYACFCVILSERGVEIWLHTLSPSLSHTRTHTPTQSHLVPLFCSASAIIHRHTHVLSSYISMLSVGGRE